ncbi:hypothetical protein F5Y16DRAFT_370190 [Xylariaceae sp. FL0255]|nr:hypothetical protein F5Y16DRAFT_370190 [Xylariaceae sp. FL0255]
MMSPQTGGQIIDFRTGHSEQALLNGRYRRNGKLQSCEPCRKSKLRCNHEVPVCSRCVKRKCVEKCVYHPHPLTKKRPAKEEQHPLTPSTTTNEDSSPVLYQSIEPSDLELPQEHHTNVSRSKYPETVSQPPAQLTRAASAPPLRELTYKRRKNTGFFGATTHMSYFSENLSHFGVAPTEDPDLNLRLAGITVTDDDIARGCQLLSFLKDFTLIHDFINRFFDIGEGMGMVIIEPIMKQWLAPLWAHHSETLKKRNPERLRRLSELLWRNTLSTISVKEDTDYKSFAQLTSGMNIRWEVIGLIAAIIGQCASTLVRTDLLFTQHNVTKPQMARKMSEISNTCLNFSREAEALDDLFLWLLIENNILTETIRGAGSYAWYRESGELNNAVVAMGLHMDVRQGKPRIPFFLEQLRQRIVVGAYSSEIGISAYLGRPPRLSHRYLNLVSPLDVNHDEMIAGDSEIARTVAALGPEGFKNGGKIERGTWLKIWYGSSPLREDVLDLTLGRHSRQEVLERAAKIQKQTQDYWNSLPQYIRQLADGPIDFSSEPGSRRRKPLETLFLFSIRQGFRSNELLLQRVLIRKTGATSDRLIEVACQIFDDLLQISKRTDIAAVLQNDMNALMSGQGMRSAAVIAVELLKQEQLPNYPKNALLPRSRTIQNLSVFAARLGDVDPSDGSFMVCDQGRKVITRILDKILSPSTIAPQAPIEQYPSHHQAHVSAMDMELMPTGATNQEWIAPGALDFSMGGDPNWELEIPFLGHDNDFMQWLESAEWELPS